MRLPFNTKTFINTYQPEAFISGIVFAEHQKHLPYFLSNYIRPVYYMNSPTLLNYYSDNPLLINHGLIKRDYIAVPKSCVQAIDWSNIARSALNNNKYVFGSLNDECIPLKSSYNKKYFPHDFILYGYDDDGFISAAYLVDGHYHEFRIAFDNFDRAVKTLDECQFMNFLEYNSSIQLGFMTDLVKNALYDYITSKELTDDGTVYGLNAFRLFADKLKEEELLDVRSICFLYEHKLLMKMRLEYMVKNLQIKLNNKAIQDYDITKSMLKTAVMLAIKYNMTYNSKISQKIGDIIRKSIFEEEIVLSGVITQL